MRRSVKRMAAWAVAATFWGAAAWAQQTVKSVAITNAGPTAVDVAMVRSYCSIKAGDTFDRTVLAGDVRRLLASGRFTHVRVDAEEVPGGVALTYWIRPKYKLVSEVRVSGAEGLGASKVRELLGFNPGDFIDDPAVAAKVAKVKEAYRKERYAFVNVGWTLEPVDLAAGLANLSVKIKEGDQSSIARVVFPGRKAVDYTELRDAMDIPAWWNPFGWFRSIAYDTGELSAGCERVRAVYKERGYLDVRIHEPVVTEVTPGKFEISITVEEGVCYRLAGVGVTGNKLYPEAELIRVAALDLGKVAAWSSIQKGADAIRDWYEQRGYMNTGVQPRMDMSGKPGDVVVRYAVTEGRLSTVRNVIIRGNTVTRDKVIRRELLVYPGEKYDGVRLRRSESRLKNLGYFSNVYGYEESAGKTDTNLVDLVFEVEEQPTGQFLAGAGFSSVDKVVGFMEVSQGNFDIGGQPFVGGGQKIKVRAEGGTKSESYTFSFVEPWFMDRRLSLGFDLYSMKRNDTDYDTSRVGGDVKLGIPVSSASRLDLVYRLEQVDISGVADTNSYDYVDENGDKQPFSFTEPKRTDSSVAATISRDTRDNFFLPTRGSRTYATATLMGGPFGFDTDLYDIEIGGSIHFSMPWGHVISARALAEVVDAYGGTEDVPLSERLFLGGARTVRGFRYRWVGPKAERTDGSGVVKPCGGQSKALASVEYSVPLISKLRLATFCDAGNVWFDPYDFDLGTLAVGAGVGLRVDFPQFPIRFDYAWPVQKDDPRSRTEKWSFWIGYGF